MLSASAKAPPLTVAIRHLNELAAHRFVCRFATNGWLFISNQDDVPKGAYSRCLRSSSDEHRACLRVHMRPGVMAYVGSLYSPIFLNFLTWCPARHAVGQETTNEWRIAIDRIRACPYIRNSDKYTFHQRADVDSFRTCQYCPDARTKHLQS
jgi:hypothetical protein